MYFKKDSLANRYHLEKLLGEGGMGKVWLAYDETLGRRVAIKEVVFRGAEAEELHFYEQATNEARLAASLSDLSDVITIYDVVEEDGRPWIIMRYENHPTLQEFVSQQGPVPSEILVPAAKRLLLSVHAVHGHGIMHRDIKPANLMVRIKNGALTLLLLDFGIARHGNDTLTLGGKLIGTPSYMAPEYLQGGRATSAGDAWSLGLVLYFALTGSNPYQKDTPSTTIAAVLHETPPALPNDNPLAPVIAGLLSRTQARRLPLDQAAAMLGDIPVPETLEVPWNRKPATRHRPRTIALSLGAALLVGAAASAPFFTADSPTPRPSASVLPSAQTSVAASISPAPGTSTPSATPQATISANTYIGNGMVVRGRDGWTLSFSGSAETMLESDTSTAYYVILKTDDETLQSAVAKKLEESTLPRSSPPPVQYPETNIALWSFTWPQSCPDNPFPCGFNTYWKGVFKLANGVVVITYYAGDDNSEADEYTVLKNMKQVAGLVTLG